MMDSFEKNQAPSPGIVDRTLGVYHRGADFFTRTIWEQHIEDMPTGKAWAYKTARVAQSTLRAVFFGDTLQVRASALRVAELSRAGRSPQAHSRKKPLPSVARARRLPAAADSGGMCLA